MHHCLMEVFYCAATCFLYRTHIWFLDRFVIHICCLAKDATEYDESKATESYRRDTYFSEPPSSCKNCHRCSSPRVEPSQKCVIFLQVIYFAIKNGDHTNPLYLEEHDLCTSCLGGGYVDGDEYNIIINVCFFGCLFTLSLTGVFTIPLLQYQALINYLNARGPEGHVPTTNDTH
jgi:hypothetical protein